MTEKQIGLLVPATNITVENEFHRIAPPELTINTERMLYNAQGDRIGDDPQVSPDLLREMNGDWEAAQRYLAKEHYREMHEDAERAARYVALAFGPTDLIVFACTGGSFTEGPGFDQEISSRIHKATNIPAITTTSCVVQALRHLGVRRLSVGTGYGPWKNQRFKTFFDAAGFEVINAETPGKAGHDNAVGGIDPQAQIEAVAKIARPEADAVFLSSTGVKALANLEQLERRVGKPVVSSNAATVWATLTYLGLTTPMKGHGRLLASLGGKTKVEPVGTATKTVS